MTRSFRVGFVRNARISNEKSKMGNDIGEMLSVFATPAASSYPARRGRAREDENLIDLHPRQY